MNSLNELLAELRSRDVQIWIDPGDPQQPPHCPRLRYQAPKDAITPDLRAQMQQSKSEIIAFLRELQGEQAAQQLRIYPVDRREPIPLSAAQQRLWYLYQFDPETPAHNMPMAYRLLGPVDRDLCAYSFQAIVDRHEILRSRFQTIAGQPQVVIEPQLRVSLDEQDFTGHPDSEREAAARAYAAQVARQPFDLETGPLIRLHLLRLEPENHVMMTNLSAMVCDGASSDIVLRELVAYYRAVATGEPPDLPALRVQYADFAHGQNRWLKGPGYQAQWDYWRQQLAGVQPFNLPGDRLRPVVKSDRGDRCFRILPKSLNEALNQLSQQCDTTLFMTLLTAFQTLLHRYGGGDDLVVTFANAGRNQVELEGLVGLFSNTLPIRTRLITGMTFRQLLGQIRQTTLQAFAHVDFPFDQLFELLPGTGPQKPSPLLQATFALNPHWTEEQGGFVKILPNLEMQSIFGYVHSGVLKYDITLVMRQTPQGLRTLLEYNQDLFDQATVERILDSFATLLRGIVANPDLPLAQLPILPAQQRQSLQLWGQGPRREIPHATLAAAFAAQVAQNPTAMAIISPQESLTYEALHQRAKALGDAVAARPATPIQSPEVQREHRAMTVEALIHRLACHQSGGGDADFSLTLGDLLNHCYRADFAPQAGERVLHWRDGQGPAAALAIWGSWLHGAAVVVAAPGSTGSDLATAIATQQITTIYLPVHVFHHLVLAHPKALASLQRVVIVGERLTLTEDPRPSRVLAAAFLADKPGRQLQVLICWAGQPILWAPFTTTMERMPLGQPVQNQQIQVLDAWGEPVPLGVTGDLVVGENFRTGYCATYDGAGQLWLRQRIQGEWVDPEVLRAACLGHQGVAAMCMSAPIADISTEPETYRAYVQRQPGVTLRATALTQMLKNQLPAALVPQLVVLDEIPLTAQGDVDLSQLPQPEPATPTPHGGANAIESQLMALWAALLGIENIERTDNFFSLGGNSLLAVRLFGAIATQFQKSLPLSTLLKAPTVAELATLLQDEDNRELWSPLVELQGGGSKPPLFCIHGGGFNVLIYRNLAHHLGQDYPVYGLQARGLSQAVTDLEGMDRLEAIATDYIQEIKKIQPQGPYYLGGLSNGGNIALEMAQQLQAQGETVALLAMFDSYGPDGIRLLSPVIRFFDSLVYALRYSVPRVAAKGFKSQGLQALMGKKSPPSASLPTATQASPPLPKPAPGSLIDRMNAVSQYILAHSPWSFFMPSEQLQDLDDPVATQLKAMEGAYEKVHREYNPQPYPGVVTLFQCAEIPPGHYRDPQQGWGAIAQGGVKTFRIPGHHTSMMQSPQLAARVKACIDVSQLTSSPA